MCVPLFFQLKEVPQEHQKQIMICVEESLPGLLFLLLLLLLPIGCRV
jgi:hypothetical protein